MLRQFIKSSGVWSVLFATITAVIVTLAVGVALWLELDATAKNTGEKAVLGAWYQQDSDTVVPPRVVEALRSQFVDDPARQYAFQYLDRDGAPTRIILGARYLATGLQTSDGTAALIVVVRDLQFAKRLLDRFIPVLLGLSLGLVSVTFLIAFVTFRRFQSAVGQMVTYIDAQSETLDPARHVPRSVVQGLEQINRHMIDHFERRKEAETEAARARAQAAAVIVTLRHDYRNRIDAIRRQLEKQMPHAEAKIGQDALDRAVRVFADMTTMQQAMIDHRQQVRQQDLSQAVKSFFDRAAPRLQAAELTVTMDIPTGLAASFCSPLLDSILENLVENAIKYTVAPGRFAVSLADVGVGLELIVRSDPAIACTLPDGHRLGDLGTRAIETDKLPGTGEGLDAVRCRMQLLAGSGATFEHIPGGPELPAQFVVTLFFAHQD